MITNGCLADSVLPGYAVVAAAFVKAYLYFLLYIRGELVALSTGFFT
jgi:hypothetical protein